MSDTVTCVQYIGSNVVYPVELSIDIILYYVIFNSRKLNSARRIFKMVIKHNTTGIMNIHDVDVRKYGKNKAKRMLYWSLGGLALLWVLLIVRLVFVQ